MRTLKKLLAGFAAAVGITTAATAATPVAVWDGDFGTTTKGTVMFNINGNTLVDGGKAIKITGENNGVVVSNLSHVASMVLVRYTNLVWTSTSTKVPLAVHKDASHNNRTGVSLASDGKTWGIWQGANWGSAGSAFSAPSDPTTPQVFAVGADAQNTSGSTYGTKAFFRNENGVASQVYFASGLRGTASGNAVSAWTIGGLYPSTSSTTVGSAATGMCILGIAVFDTWLTADEVAAYRFASEITEKTISVTEDSDWSAMIADIDDPSFCELTVNVTGTPTITLDDATKFLSITFTGTPVLAAEDSVYEDGCWQKTLLEAETLTIGNATFADVKAGFAGAYASTATAITLRGQNKEVISINIAGGSGGGSGADSPTENLVSGSDYYGIAPTLGDSWNNINRQWQNGGNQTITIESPNAYTGTNTIQRPTMSLSATGKNTYLCSSISNPFLRGYLDDGNGVTVTVHGVPYTKYDVIVYVTSDSSLALAPVTVNGTTYTYVNGVLSEGSTAWGVGMYATPEIGKNAIRINDCTGELLTISSAARASGTTNPRGTFCAVQVINKGDVVVTTEYVGEMTGNVVWTDGSADANLTSLGDPWVSGDYSTITITNKAENATFSFAQATEGLSIKFVSEEGCALTMDATNIVQYGKLTTYDFTEAAGGVTIQLPTDVAFDPTTLPTITGDWKYSSTGILVFDGTFPTSEQQTFFKSDEWQGTVWLKNVTIGGTSFDNFCNTNSILKFTGVKGWLRHNSGVQGVPTLELEDDGDTLAFEVNDSSENKVYEFAKLTGDGTFRFATKAGSSCVMVLKDVSEFTGKLLSTAGDGTAARPIFIGATGTYSTKSLISVASDMTINAPCGWEAGEVAFGTNLTVKGASVGTIIVSNVTNAVPVLETKVTLDGVDGIYCLVYDTEAKSVKIADAVGFTVAGCENATFTVAGAFENGGSYYAADGAPITVTYTASEGYTFLSTGTDTLVVEGTAASGASFSTSEVPVLLSTPFIYTVNEGEEGAWTLGGTVVTKDVVDTNLSRDIWKQGDGSMTNVVLNRTYFVKEGTMVAGTAANKTGTVTVDADATFDFNGKVDGFITVNLNGGSLVNNGGNMGTGSRQMNGLALTEDSTIGGTGNFGLVSSGYGANTLDLGGKTLTKIDNNSFWLCNTTVSNGTLNVTAGAISVVNYETTFTDDAMLVLGAGTTLNVGDKLNIAAITANGATINNTYATKPFAFSLTGTATLTGDGNWGTNTLATVETVATIGEKRGMTFAGVGTVNVTLTDDEISATGTRTIFTVADGATAKVGTVTYKGKDITDQCTISGGTITAIAFEAKIGDVFYSTFAEALDAAQDESEITLLKDVTFAPNGMYSITNTIYLTLNGHKLTGNGGKTFEVVNNAALFITATDSTVEGVRINVGKATNNNGTLYIMGGDWSITSNTLIHVNGTCKNSAVTIYDATMTSDGDNAIQLNGSGTFTLDDVVATGATAVYAKGGTISMTGTYTGNGPLTPYTVNNNGSNATGDAVVFEKVNTATTGYANELSATILSGTYTSVNGVAIGCYAMEGETAISGFIKGGTFSSDPTALLATGYVAEEAAGVWTVREAVAITGVTLDIVAATVKVGETTNLVATVAPANADVTNTVWTSDNVAVATVDADGVVTAVAAGNATITVTKYAVGDSTASATCAVTVEEVKPTTYTITITEPTNGTLETSVTNDVAAGTTVTVTATPADGYALESITTNGTAITGTTFEMPAEDVTVAATFTASGPTPVPGYDTKVTPVPGEENTYKLTPGEGKTVVAVENVEDGDTLVVDATVTAIQVDEGFESGAIIKVMNSGNTAEVPNDAMYGWDGNSFGTALNPDAEVEVGEETIPVTPEVDTTAETPVGVTDTQASVAMRTIPGLTYQLIRGDEPGAIETALTTEGAVKTATDVDTTLVDTAKPDDKAFYKVQVSK